MNKRDNILIREVRSVGLWKALSWAIERGMYGWARADCWDLDSYLTKVIIESVAHFKKKKVGAPASFFKYKKNSWSTTPYQEKQGHKKWGQILDDIVEGFKAIEALEEEMPNPGSEREKALIAKADKGKRLFIKWFDALWW